MTEGRYRWSRAIEVNSRTLWESIARLPFFGRSATGRRSQSLQRIVRDVSASVDMTKWRDVRTTRRSFPRQTAKRQGRKFSLQKSAFRKRAVKEPVGG